MAIPIVQLSEVMNELRDLRDEVRFLRERREEDRKRIDELERWGDNVCRMAMVWEERANEFRSMWEEAIRWERAARAREEMSERLALQREAEARRREEVWAERSRQMARWEMSSRRREEEARRREADARRERRFSCILYKNYIIFECIGATKL